jgi:hypothetical protein
VFRIRIPKGIEILVESGTEINVLDRESNPDLKEIRKKESFNQAKIR